MASRHIARPAGYALAVCTLGSQVCAQHTGRVLHMLIVCEDTQILSKMARAILAGLPMTPVPRIAATILCVATDPDPQTSGRPWLLLDHGDVLRLDSAEITEGTYRILDARMRTTVAAVSGLQYYTRIAKDLGKVFNPVLNGVLIMLVVLFLWRST